ncbi:hypothetical protein NDU88_000219, partial [Pleurodeles waltl]
ILPSEEGAMESHHPEGADAGDPQLAECPLSQEVGGHETLGPEDHGGQAWAVLPNWKGRTSDHNPLMSRILAVVYPDLDGHLRGAQQPH